MTNAELIAGLRYCGGKEKHCKLCPSYDTCHAEVDGLKQILLAAADLIEAQAKRIEELNTKCADLQSQINSMENEIEELMPKEGEWRDDNGAVVPLDDYGYTTDLCQCSVCGDWLIASDEYHVRGRYCPNCGSRMRKGAKHERYV